MRLERDMTEIHCSGNKRPFSSAPLEGEGKEVSFILFSQHMRSRIHFHLAIFMIGRERANRPELWPA